jgi:hypothetical protein
MKANHDPSHRAEIPFISRLVITRWKYGATRPLATAPLTKMDLTIMKTRFRFGLRRQIAGLLLRSLQRSAAAKSIRFSLAEN